VGQLSTVDYYQLTLNKNKMKMQEKNTKFLYLISVVAALGGLLFGFDTAVISGVVPFIEKQFSLSGTEIGWVVSSLILGCIVGVVFSGAPTDKYGRKKVLSTAALFFAISALGTALSGSILVFVIFRVLGGFAVGIASMVSPMYIAEIAPAKQRGQLVSLNQLTIVIGILIAFFSNYLLVDTGENNWRWMLCVMALPAFLFFVALFFVPESPRWLVQKGEIDKAKSTLVRINGTEVGSKELEIIQNSLKNKKDSGFKAVFAKELRLPLMVGIGLAIFQQITGINTIMYYAPMIFEKSGLSIGSAIYQTILIGVINLLFSLVAIYFVDRIGRKPLLVIGSSIMAISLLILSMCFSYGWSGTVTLVAILSFIAAFASTLGPVTWVIISELFPNHVRGKAMSVSIVFVWISCFFVSLLFPILLEKIGGASTFLLLAIMCVGSLLFDLKFVKETNGKELEEIS
jgi:SP family arabinose:H+ symporter-like MFS transporter